MYYFQLLTYLITKTHMNCMDFLMPLKKRPVTEFI